jgi:hypothetical protein
MGKNQHVVPNNGKWAVKGAGNEKATVITNTQKQAIEKAKEIAKNQSSEVVITEKMGKSVIKTAMVMIQTRLKIQNINKGVNQLPILLAPTVSPILITHISRRYSAGLNKGGKQY